MNWRIKFLGIGILVLGCIKIAPLVVKQPVMPGESLTDKQVEQLSDEYRIMEKDTFDEKATDVLFNWKSTPQTSKSPFVDDSGNNPVEEGIKREHKEEPINSKSPFFNPKTGENIVEKGIKEQKSK